MADESDLVDDILEDLDFDRKSGSAAPSNPSRPKNESDQDGLTREGRLQKLTQAGALTQEEYDVLTDYYDRLAGRRQREFGTPIYTSEGREFDFSIVGVFKNVDTTLLALPDFLTLDEAKSDEFSWENKGGPGRTIACFQIYNHSSKEVKLKHKNVEFIGDNEIAYNYDGNPLVEEKLYPGWRTSNWVDIGPETRIQYASVIEMPVDLASLKLSGYWADVHDIEVTNEMFFPESELPTAVDLDDY